LESYTKVVWIQKSASCCELKRRVFCGEFNCVKVAMYGHISVFNTWPCTFV